MRNSSRSRKTIGFTLLEVLVTIVIIGIAATAIMSVFTQAARTSADPLIQRQALAIAEAYIEEIQLKAFSDPDALETGAAEAGEVRATFDDVQDYNDSSVDGAVADLNGSVIAALSAYTVAVNVSTAALGSITQASGQALRIDVSVSHPAVDPIQLSAFRTNY